MDLSEQVVSLDLAKRLKELGAKQKSLFVWYTNADNGHLLYLGEDNMRPMEAKTYSAFTVAELGEMLPNDFYPYTSFDGETTEHDVEGSFYKTFKVNKTWICEDCFEEYKVTANAEADARAKMLIYLLENKLVN